jgi:hypothetical protein
LWANQKERLNESERKMIPSLIPDWRCIDLRSSFLWVDCLLTRHHEGFARQQRLERNHPLRKSVGAAFRGLTTETLRRGEGVNDRKGKTAVGSV